VSGSTRQPGGCTSFAWHLHARDRSARHPAATARRVRAAERGAHNALTRSGFTEPDIAADVLRQVQVLTRASDLAVLDYTTAGPRHDRQPDQPRPVRCSTTGSAGHPSNPGSWQQPTADQRPREPGQSPLSRLSTARRGSRPRSKRQAGQRGAGIQSQGRAGDVVLGRLMAAHADQRDAPQGAVGLPVAAAVQPVPVGPAGRHRDRGGPAEPGEGRLRAEPVAVVPGGDQQLPGGLHADPGQRQERGRDGGDQRGELGVEVVDLSLQACQRGPVPAAPS